MYETTCAAGLGSGWLKRTIEFVSSKLGAPAAAAASVLSVGFDNIHTGAQNCPEKTAF